MTLFQIIAALCLCVGGLINIVSSKRNERKHRELCEYEKLLNETAAELIEEADRHIRHEEHRQKQPELFITADSATDSEITLKLSLDDIDINKVQDRATREFLLKRRLMTSFCPN